MNTIYLRRRRKVLLNEGVGIQTPDKVAMMQKNLEGFGFVMGPDLMDRVATLSNERLAGFYEELVNDLQEIVGAHRVFRPMYPDFPEQVMAMSEAHLYLNAIVHYITNKLPVFPSGERPLLAEMTELKVVELGDREDFEAIFRRLVGARTSLSLEDKADLIWFVSQYGDDIRRLIPDEVPSKENVAVLGAALFKYVPSATDVLSSRLQTATDVLRLAVACSGGDVSLAVPARFGAFNRAERKLILSWIERCGDPVEDMLRWKARWIRLGERLHPGDFSDEFPKTWRAFKTLRNDEKVATFNHLLEKVLTEGDTAGALRLLVSRPGDLARRLDHLLRLSGDPEPVLNAFALGAHKVSTPVLLQMHSHFDQRDTPPSLRIFFPKGDVSKVHAESRKLPALGPGLSSRVVAACERALMERFGKLPPLGCCWVDPDLKKYMVPLAQRSASKALRTLTRGTRLVMEPTRVLRFFVWWKNGKGRADIDLSAALFDDSESYMDVLSYYNLKGFGGCHSGDIVDAPHGASEFIDVETELLRQRGVRYIVMTLSSYTRQPYCDLPECCVGWMARKEANSGEIFEPRTVINKLDVASNTMICIPAVFDLASQEVIWADLALTHHPSLSNNVQNNLSSMSLMLQALTSLAKPDLHTLFTLHAKARGTLASPDGPVDTIFSVDHGITPFEIDRIRAEFL